MVPRKKTAPFFRSNILPKGETKSSLHAEGLKKNKTETRWAQDKIPAKYVWITKPGVRQAANAVQLCRHYAELPPMNTFFLDKLAVAQPTCYGTTLLHYRALKITLVEPVLSQKMHRFFKMHFNIILPFTPVSFTSVLRSRRCVPLVTPRTPPPPPPPPSRAIALL
jgi:hypothetical protein